MPKNMDQFFDWQNGKYEQLLKAVHITVQNLLPGVQVKFQWGGPHYHWHGHLGYLSPHTKSAGVYLGFVRGFELSDSHGLLNTDGNTTMVKKLYIQDLKDLHDKQNIIRETLMEAALLNETSKAHFPKN